MKDPTDEESRKAAEGMAGGGDDQIPQRVDEGGAVIPDGNRGQEQQRNGCGPCEVDPFGGKAALQQRKEEHGAENQKYYAHGIRRAAGQREEIVHDKLRCQKQKLKPILFHCRYLPGAFSSIIPPFPAAFKTAGQRKRNVPVDGISVL